MKKNLILPLILGIAQLSAFVQADTSNDLSIKPIGLKIVWDDTAKQFDGFKTMNAEKGIELAFLVHSPKTSIIDIDEKESKLTIGGVHADIWFFPSQSISKDRHYLKLQTNAKRAKATNGKVTAKGSVTVSVASGKKKVETKNITWKKGAKVIFPKDSGLPVFTVDKVGKTKWGNEKWFISLKCTQDFKRFASVAFIDEQGKIHKAVRGSWSSFGFGKNVHVNVEYKTSEKITSGKMVVEYWSGLKKIQIPIDMNIGFEGK